MPARKSLIFCSLLLLLALCLPVLAITTVEVNVVCPVCHTKNKFYDYASWGSYIYRYPSRFQLIFWPHTSSATVYSCKKCRLSLYMWDFKEFPKDKIEPTAQLLKDVKLSGEFKTYTDIPTSEKLQIAEKVYQLLRRDDKFWLHFYRVLGYHFAREKKLEQAAAARRHALEICQKMLASPESQGSRKELLVISAAMHHFLDEDEAARADLKLAASLKYVVQELGEERSKGYDAYLSSLIEDYITAIDNHNVPKDDEEAN